MTTTRVNPPKKIAAIEDLLGESVLTIGRAIVHLHQAIGTGWPATTFGSGSPGGGSSTGTSSVTERAITTPDRARDALGRLDAAATFVAISASEALHTYTGQHPFDPVPATMQRVVHAYRCIRIIGTLPAVPCNTKPLQDSSETVASICRNWSPDPRVPSQPADFHRLATDLTGMWCTSCLRVGARNPRHQTSDLCRWCLDFKRTYNEEPPHAIVNARANSASTVELGRLVALWQTQTRQRRKKARRRR